MKRLKIGILAMIWILMGAWQVSAQANNSRDSVEKLLLLMNQDQFVRQVFEHVKEQQRQQLQQMNGSEEQTAVITTYFNKIYDVIQTEMSWDKIKDDYIDLYLSVYSQEEIEALISFYEAPLGRKVIEKMPELMEQSMLISQKYMMKMLPKIQEIQQEMSRELVNQQQPNLE